MDFEHTKSTADEALSAQLKEKIDGLGIDIANMRGQVYDGATNMARKRKKCAGKT